MDTTASPTSTIRRARRAFALAAASTAVLAGAVGMAPQASAAAGPAAGTAYDNAWAQVNHVDTDGSGIVVQATQALVEVVREPSAAGPVLALDYGGVEVGKVPGYTADQKLDVRYHLYRTPEGGDVRSREYVGEHVVYDTLAATATGTRVYAPARAEVAVEPGYTYSAEIIVVHHDQSFDELDVYGSVQATSGDGYSCGPITDGCETSILGLAIS